MPRSRFRDEGVPAARNWRPGCVPGQPHPFINTAGVALTVILVALVGVAASWGVITRKPLGTLREQ